MNKQLIHDYKILQNIFKNARDKKRKCFLCDKESINSHILQRNGVLSGISYLNHVRQIEPNDFFNASDKGAIGIKNVGVKSALSLSLFCNEHDTILFKPIEDSVIDFYSYYSQLLFSFRTFCAAIRVKEINADILSRVLNSKLLVANETFRNTVLYQLEVEKISSNLKDFYQIEMLNELAEPQDKFHFETLDLKYLPVCSSSAFSTFNSEVKEEDVNAYNASWINCLFINLVPFKGQLKLILGYHKSQVDPLILDYIESWKSLNTEEQAEKLTEMIATKISETWAISPTYFDKIDKIDLLNYLEFWPEQVRNPNHSKKINFNLSRAQI